MHNKHHKLFMILKAKWKAAYNVLSYTEEALPVTMSKSGV